MSRLLNIPRCPGIRFAFTLLAASCLLSTPLFAQAVASATLPTASVTIPVSRALVDSLIRLPHQFIVAGTDTVILDSVRVLRRGSDYVLTTRSGSLRFDSLLIAPLMHDGIVAHTVTVRYAYFPFRFQDSYARRTLVALPDNSGKDSIRVA
jgi:hypothetical protein